MVHDTPYRHVLIHAALHRICNQESLYSEPVPNPFLQTVNKIHLFHSLKQKNMKHLLFISASISLLLFAAGCGNNLIQNRSLGIIPAIYMEFEKEREAQKQQMVKEVSSANNMDKSMGIKAKYDKRVNDLTGKMEKKAAAELERIRGREIPYAFSYEENRFKILSATIESINAASGAISVKLLVEARKDLVGTYYDNLYFMVIGAENRVLYRHSVNPFTTILPMSPSRFGADKMIAANALCCEEGSMLMLYCGNYDMTMFKEVVFVSQEEFNKRTN